MLNVDAEIVAYSVVGAIVPDLLRLLSWARSPKITRGDNPLKDGATYLSAVIQLALGVVAAHLLQAATPIQAAALAYAAPDVLTRVLGSLATQQTRGFNMEVVDSQTVSTRVLKWWRGGGVRE